MPSVVQILFSSIAATVGIIFNGYILFVFIWNRRIQTANRLLLLHLAFVDTIFCLVILLYNTSLSATLDTTTVEITHGISPKTLRIPILEIASESHLCKGHGFFWTLLPLVLMWNVCGLSCDRYAAISSPLHYSRLVNTKRASCFIFIIWLVGAAFASGPLIGICPYTFWDARWACTANCLSTRTIDLSYAVSYTTVAVVLPIIIIFVCNLHMLLISKYHRHNIATAIYEVTLKAQATVTHQNNPNYLSKFKGKNALFTIAQVIGSLLTFVVPYHIVLVWEAANGQTCDEMFVSLTTILLTCSPSVNAYVYGVKSRILRETVKRLLQQHVIQKETNKTIKRRLSEIFSENPQTQHSSRRMSAPPEYGRKLSLSNSQCTSNDRDMEVKSKRIKTPFLRSVSLPTRTSSTDAFTMSKTEEISGEVVHKNKDTRDSSDSSRRHRPLPRGESAPEEEDIVLYYTLPDKDISSECKAFNNGRRSNTKKTFVRSSSYPSAQDPSFINLKRQRLLAMKAQKAVDIEEDIHEIELLAHYQGESNITKPNVCWSEEGTQTQKIFQISQV